MPSRSGGPRELPEGIAGKNHPHRPPPLPRPPRRSLRSTYPDTMCPRRTKAMTPEGMRVHACRASTKEQLEHVTHLARAVNSARFPAPAPAPAPGNPEPLSPASEPRTMSGRPRAAATDRSAPSTDDTTRGFGRIPGSLPLLFPVTPCRPSTTTGGGVFYPPSRRGAFASRNAGRA